MKIGLHVKYPLFLLDFNELEFPWQIFEKYSNIKLHENSSSGSWVFTCGPTDRQTEMAKLVVAFCNFAKAPNYTVKLILLEIIMKLCIILSYLKICLSFRGNHQGVRFDVQERVSHLCCAVQTTVHSGMDGPSRSDRDSYTRSQF
jgi:hypothetical protein